MNTEPVQAEGFPGFYEIPGFKRYAISPDGVVIEKNSGGMVVKFYTTKDKYVQGSLIKDSGYKTIRGRHRLLAIVFKHPGVAVDDLMVNHINGVKGDDRLDNLEWVTPQGNVEHAGAIGLSPKCWPISVRDVDTGEVSNYPSIIACARQLGLSKDAVMYRVKSGEARVYPERKQYRAFQSDQPWRAPESIEHSLKKYGTSKGVLVRNVRNDQVWEFEKLTDLAEHLQVTPSVLTAWMRKPGQPVLPGFIQLKWAHDPSPWREITDPYLELDRGRRRRCVQVVDDKTRVVEVFLSAAECAKAKGLTVTTLNWRLKTNGQHVYQDGCRYGYYPYLVSDNTDCPVDQ